ncbi:MAG: glycosyltransferase [Xanthomonadales bacterium]|nr:glycosyltransferase [Xanthomonadales bacterium]MDH4019154.1 glycosyltransferase [Xanthomonadales bacterium]
MNAITKQQGDVSVSVIVPCFNSAATIEKCLESLESQNTSFKTEVTVIDSSVDETPDLVRSRFPNVKLIHLTERHSCGAARNVGLKSTSSDIVLFTDSDCIVPSNWVQTMTEQLTSGGADAVCSAIGNGTPDSVSGTIGYYLEFFRFLPHDGEPVTTDWLLGGTSGFRRKVLQDFQYSDVSLGDDFLMSHRLKSQGAHLMMVSSVAVSHLNRTGFKLVFDYQRKIGMAATQYRAVSNPLLISRLSRVSFVTLAAPLVIVPWVGSHILFKLGFRKFIQYLLYSPVSFVMSCAWTAGFIKDLRQYRVKDAEEG